MMEATSSSEKLVIFYETTRQCCLCTPLW